MRRPHHLDRDKQHDDLVQSASGSVGEALVELQELTERLRRECPWDREQTAKTIVPHTVEEAYEVADAALAGDDAKLLDEVGDLLFQAYFLALLLEERGTGSLESAARGVHAKLVAPPPARLRRGRGRDRGARAAELGADQARGRGPRPASSTTSPSRCPACCRRGRSSGGRLRSASSIPTSRARSPTSSTSWQSCRPSCPRPIPRPRPSRPPRVAAELGDLLFACVNVARKLNVDPELELRAATRRFRERVESAERLAAADGKRWVELPLSEQDHYFDRAKELE